MILVFLSAGRSDAPLSPRSSTAEVSDAPLSSRSSSAECSEDSLSSRSSSADVSEDYLSSRSSSAERAESILLALSAAGRRRARVLVLRLWVHISRFGFIHCSFPEPHKVAGRAVRRGFNSSNNQFVKKRKART